MPLTARKPSDQQYLKMLIHSPAGHGKTHFLGTAQMDDRTYPMAFLNFEGGDLTLAGLDIDVFDMRDFDDFKEAQRMLTSPKSPYKSVGVDSVSETQVEGIMSILAQGAGSGAQDDQLGQPGWGLILVRMRRFIRDLKRLPMHTFMTALTKDDLMPRVGQVKVPSVQGAFASELPGIVDVVAYLALLEETPGQVDRVMLLKDNPKFSVKCRTPWGVTVPSELLNPDVTMVLDTLGFK